MKKTLLIIIALFSISISAQNVRTYLDNGNITFDGSNYYYEADVFIEAIDGLTETLIGSGQLYFNYNTEAFGENINNSAGFSATTPYNSGEYFLGQKQGLTNFYTFVVNNNTSSRISWAFLQEVSSGAMTEMVSTTARKLVHIAFKFIDIDKPAHITLENDENQMNGGVNNVLDQFFTPCGPFDNATNMLDCTANVDARNQANQFNNATIEDTQSTDTMIPVITLSGNDPQIILQGDPYVELGATTDDGSAVIIDDSEVNTSVPGDYNVYYDATDLSGNAAAQLIRIVTVQGATLSTAEFDNVISVTVYPNPVEDFAFIDTEFEVAYLYNLSGLLVASTTSEKLDMNKLASGVYLLKVTSKNGKSTVTVIKQ